MSQHDLMELEEARDYLNMSLPKFQLLVESGKIPAFRANGRLCFRREDIVTVARERKAGGRTTQVEEREEPIEKPNREKAVSARASAKTEIVPRENEKEAAQSSNRRKAIRDKAHGSNGDSPHKATSTAERSKSSPKRPSRRTKKRKVPLWMVAAGVLVAVVLLVTVFGRGNGNDVAAKATNGKGSRIEALPFDKRFAAPGLVEPSDGEVIIRSQVTGRLSEVKAKEGQRVKEGDVIAILQNDDQMARWESAKADVSVAQAELKTLKASLEAEIDGANRRVDHLRAEYNLLKEGHRKEAIARAEAEHLAAKAQAHLRKLEEERFCNPNVQKGVFTKQQQDQARQNARVAEARLKAAEERLKELKAGFRAEEIAKGLALLKGAEAEVKRLVDTKQSRIDAAEAQVKKAEAAARLAKAEYDKTVITSPISGLVVQKYRYTGDTVGMLPPEPIIKLVDDSDLRVRADVDEGDYLKVYAGQRVKITADALRERGIPYVAGTVVLRGNEAGQKRFSTGEAREKMDVKVVQTIIRLDTSDQACPFLLNLRVDVYFEDKEPTPASASLNEDKAND